MSSTDPAFVKSARMIELLKKQGRSQKDVAALLGVSESYISRVASGQRCLTFNHMATLEDRLGLPLHVLLLEAELAEEQRPEIREMLSEAIGILRESYQITNPPEQADTDSAAERVTA